MSSKADIQAGRAYVKLFLKDDMTKALQRSMRRVATEMRETAAAVSKIAIGMAGATAAVAVPIAASIKAASDMQETMSKFNTVFGENAKTMKEWADTFASVGRSKKEVATFLASTQDLLVPLGFAADEGAELSKQITQLAFDLGSFANKADAEVLNDLQDALTGSGEVMKKYGVVLNETAVKQELVKQGLKPEAATEAQKAFARLTVIMEGTAFAQGDLARTGDSFANQWKRMGAVIDDAKVQMGDLFLPAATAVAQALGDVATAMSKVSMEADFQALSVDSTAVAVAIINMVENMAIFVDKIRQARLLLLDMSIATSKAIRAEAKIAEKAKPFAEKMTNPNSITGQLVRAFPGTANKTFGEELDKQIDELEEQRKKLKASIDQGLPKQLGDSLRQALDDVNKQRSKAKPTPAPSTAPPPPEKAPTKAPIPNPEVVKGAAGGLLRLLTPVAEAAKSIKERGGDLLKGEAFKSADSAATTTTRPTPLGVTFSAEAAVAAGFRGTNPQQRSLDDLKKSNKEAVEQLKRVVEGVWRMVDGLVYG